MEHEINCTWKDKMAFETDVLGHSITVDAGPESGGEDSGPRPKPLLLTALAGCTAMDVISILQKMKITPENFNVKVSGKLTEDHPKYYHSIHIVYEFTGPDLPAEKLEKAVNLSQEKYCGVSALLKKAVNLSWEISIR